MRRIHHRLDIGSWLVVLLTLVLFVAALFFKGFGHDLLLEAGVFLVSVKLIMMAYRSSVEAKLLNDRLDGLQATLTRTESLLESKCLIQPAEEPPATNSGSSAAASRDQG
jgi:hypothetical protein